MKLLLISDVHASIDALRAVWAAESDADAIMCAGDIIDWGFHPHEVIAFMKEHNVICVHGNHDLEILEHLDAGHREEPGKETNFATYSINQLTEEDIAWLEGRIDALQEALKPVECFTIPGGCELSSLCHICRTICRRAERRAIEAAESYEVDRQLLVLLNRLSDYLYALCRTITEQLPAEEVLWRP